MWSILPAFAALVTIAAPLNPAPHRAENKAAVTLLAEHAGAVPGGTVMLALEFTIPAKWHLYYDGQNDSGQPASIDRSKLPAGVTAGEILWPAPELQVLPGDIADHVYEKHLTLLVPVTLSKDVKPGQTLKLDLPVSWMECSSECRLASSTVSASVAVVAKPDEIKPTPAAGKIETARKALPQPLPTDGSATAKVTGDSLEIAVKGATSIAFFPSSASTPLRNLISEGHAKGEKLVAKLKGSPKADPKNLPVSGIVKAETAKGMVLYTVNTTLKAK